MEATKHQPAAAKMSILPEPVLEERQAHQGRGASE